MDLDARIDQALKFLIAGNTEQAKALCIPVLPMAKFNARLALVLGASLLGCGEMAVAVEHLNHAIRLTADKPGRVLKIARLMHEQGHTSEAFQLIEYLCDIRGDATFRALAASWRLPIIARSD